MDYKTLLVSTSYSFSIRADDASDALEDFSRQSWDFLEKKLKNVFVEKFEGTSKATFLFCDDSKFFVSANAGENQSDNLLVITDKDSGAWFVTS